MLIILFQFYFAFLYDFIHFWKLTFTFVILSFNIFFLSPSLFLLGLLLTWYGLVLFGDWDNFILIINTILSHWKKKNMKNGNKVHGLTVAKNERLFVILWRIRIHRKEIYIYPCICLSSIRMLFHLYYYYFWERWI